jgi:GNAT superfamily N-acetyltransferase
VKIVLRDAGRDDLEHVRWALDTALAWNPERHIPSPEAALEHPEAARYQSAGRPWGHRPVDDRVAGVAYCRLFSDGDHGHGYVDDCTPEVAVAACRNHRGRGLGGRLMTELAEMARAAGFSRLSLSVDADNPARRLYERLG